MSSKVQPDTSENHQYIWKLFGKLDELFVPKHTSLDKQFRNSYCLENKSIFPLYIFMMMCQLLNTVDSPFPCVLHPWIQPTTEPTDAESADAEGRLYQTILHRGFKHPQILVSAARPVLEPVPSRY